MPYKTRLQNVAAAERGSNPPPNEEKNSAVSAVVALDVARRPHPAKPIPPVITPAPEHATAYQPVHVAIQALLQAIEQLTKQYGKTWLAWESAQTDLVQLHAVLGFSRDLSRAPGE